MNRLAGSTCDVLYDEQTIIIKSENCYTFLIKNSVKRLLLAFNSNLTSMARMAMIVHIAGQLTYNDALSGIETALFPI